jgi:hypothetical protein
VSFKELQYGLGKLGFRDPDKLAVVFKRVNTKGNGMLDFTEFMALTYIFSVERGDLSCMFAFKENAKMVKDCFNLMDKVVRLYDKDKNYLLDRAEVSASNHVSGMGAWMKVCIHACLAPLYMCTRIYAKTYRYEMNARITCISTVESVRRCVKWWLWCVCASACVGRWRLHRCA